MVNKSTTISTVLGVIVLLAIVGVSVGVVTLGGENPIASPSPTPTPTQTVPPKPTYPLMTVVADELVIPWDIAFLPAGEMLITERRGTIIHLLADGTKSLIPVPRPKPKGEGGLLGITLHPRFPENHFVYIYMTTKEEGSSTVNAVFRYVFQYGTLTQEKTIISGIPGALYHDGGRMEFGPDGFLYITTGDAQTSIIAQDRTSLGGKILRLTDEGQIAPKNPFGTAVYTYGHRNPQGLAWDSHNKLWETEHGRSGVLSGYDEVNLIEAGANYGWPTIEGPASHDGMTSPVLQSGAEDTWAPASLAYLDGKLYFGGLKGEALYEVTVDGENLINLKKHFYKDFGRIRTVRVGPDGMLYLTTSNRDGRGTPHTADDKVLRINPELL